MLQAPASYKAEKFASSSADDINSDLKNQDILRALKAIKEEAVAYQKRGFTNLFKSEESRRLSADIIELAGKIEALQENSQKLLTDFLPVMEIHHTLYRYMNNPSNVSKHFYQQLGQPYTALKEIVGDYHDLYRVYLAQQLNDDVKFVQALDQKAMAYNRDTEHWRWGKSNESTELVNTITTIGGVTPTQAEASRKLPAVLRQWQGINPQGHLHARLAQTMADREDVEKFKPRQP